VRIFTLPVPPFEGGGPAVELTFIPLSLGTLGAESALSIQLDLHILTPLGIMPDPYTDDGGRLVARFEIGAEHVSGVVVLSETGTGSFTAAYPLQVVAE